MRSSWRWKRRFSITRRRLDAPDPATLPAGRGQSRLPGRLHSIPHRLRAGALARRACALWPIAPTERRRRLRRSSSGGWADDVTLLNITPDGRNINDGCGALHPDFVAAEVEARGADLGLTFDGDADRCMLAGAQQQRHQRRRDSADGRARSESARPAHRRSGRGHDHVQHGPGSRAQALAASACCAPR